MKFSHDEFIRRLVRSTKGNNNNPLVYYKKKWIPIKSIYKYGIDNAEAYYRKYVYFRDTCVICGNKVSFRSILVGYNRTCCSKCKALDAIKPNKIKKVSSQSNYFDSEFSGLVRTKSINSYFYVFELDNKILKIGVSGEKSFYRRESDIRCKTKMEPKLVFKTLLNTNTAYDLENHIKLKINPIKFPINLYSSEIYSKSDLLKIILIIYDYLSFHD